MSTITFDDYKKKMKQEIKDIGYEEILIRIAWNVTRLMNEEKKK